jgi:hypothetical protein
MFVFRSGPLVGEYEKRATAVTAIAVDFFPAFDAFGCQVGAMDGFQSFVPVVCSSLSIVSV